MTQFIYSVSDVACAWGITPERVRQLIVAGKLAPTHVLRTGPNRAMYLFTDIPEHDDVMALLAEMRL